MKEICELTSLLRKAHLIAPVILLLASSAFTQNSASTGVPIVASVLRGLSIGDISGPLNFGDAASHTIVEGAVIGSDTLVSVTAYNPRTVKLIVAGDATQSINITYLSSTPLNSGGKSLTYTPDVGFSSSSSDDHAAQDFGNGGGSFTLESSGTGYIWVGGSLSGVSAATPGAYSGALTITVSY